MAANRREISRGRRTALLADDDELGTRFDEALRLHERTPDLFEAARTRLAYVGRLRRARRRVRAREHLRAALNAFDRLGAEPWSELARAELEATGQTARRRDPSTADALTPQELQIAQLLAARKTTREAAAALFLSPKTVEYHLRTSTGSSTSARAPSSPRGSRLADRVATQQPRPHDARVL